ncbi:MAG TPA: FadR/GntR family transcriptional regulator [Symbiobacteriaceae bacterium]|nr:FadR/GntR family transcriptional regulator [Symbiobacteriaceae bacterium]
MGRFERIANQRIYQQIVEQISRMIREGVLRPGDRLPPERQLAEEFGVSRAAVREALSALGLMGLVEVRQGEGTFVRVSQESLVNPLALMLTMENDQLLELELLEIRAALEAEAARLAALRWEPEDMAVMESAMEVIAKSVTSDEKGAAADWAFHRAIATASGNGLLLRIMTTLTDNMMEALHRYRERLMRHPGMDRVLVEEHQNILDAIRSRDPERAYDRMRYHIERTKAKLYGDTRSPSK